MAVTYTEQYETKKAKSETTSDGAMYEISYIIKGPVGGTPNQIDAYINDVTGGERIRIGYGSFSEIGNTVRFEKPLVPDLQSQLIISTQYFNDIRTILT